MEDFINNLKNDYIQILIAIIIPTFGGLVGSKVTKKSVRTWYRNIKKPWYNPPNYVFPIVWMILYPLSGYSSYCIWKTGAILPLVPYAFSVVFNNLWTPLFFSENMYFGLAFIDLIFLWCSLFISFLSFLPISEFAAYALLPYLAWVTFAGVLNFSIWQNNSSKSPPKTASADANGKKSN